ncbi:MAG: rhodanese-like domain-containing protein [Microbacteriaceae bacterium]|nr:rhodanese-like domain-containing protein [Microbacteriaceae bacterium]
MPPGVFGIVGTAHSSWSERSPVKKIFTAILLVFGVTLGVAGCSSPSEPVGLAEGTVIIDVRTPGEFATGHLEGALNIDVQSADFAAQVNQLDPAADYFIYCRSGNRSGQAIAQMSNMGFTSMVNGRSVQQASDYSGVAVVTD